MSQKRAGLDLDENENQIHLEDCIAAATQADKVDKQKIKKELAEVGKKTKFVSREPQKKGKVGRPKSTVYLVQKNIKMRLGMPEILAEVTAATGGSSDQETIEKALLAFIEKEGLKALKTKYEKAISS